MDNLSKLAASGGSDIYGAGTYRFFNNDIDTITLSGSSGTATITCNGLSKLATFNSTLTQTATDFVTAWAAAYLLMGITVTSSTNTLIFTSIGLTKNGATAIVNVTTDLAGTIVSTKSGYGTAQLPHPIYAINIVTDAVITSYREYPRGTGSGIYKTNSYVTVGTKTLLTTTITAGSPVVVFEWPVVEIVIASGTVTLDFVK